MLRIPDFNQERWQICTFVSDTAEARMNRKLVFYTLLTICLLNAMAVNAQQTGNPYRDSIVQLFGVIMTADSLRGVPAASVIAIVRALVGDMTM